jgi:hypothetical protein
MINKKVIVRTRSAGVFAGALKDIQGQTAIVAEARRLWYWEGAASLSQLAVDGVSKPGACKFPTPVPEVLLFEVIEILPLSEKAEASIAAVPEWSA